MITPSYGPTASERVLPALALDFTTATLDARVTLTRALNTATCVGSNGLITSVNANLPRFNYNPITTVCDGLLVEETRDQCARFTESISAWSKSSTTGVANVDTAPDGTLTSDLIYPSSTGTYRQAYLTSTAVPTSGTVAISVFAKPAGKNWLIIYNFNTTAAVAWFNVATGVVGTLASGWTGTIEQYANGYYRCTAVGTASTGQYVTYGVADADNSTSVTANSTDGLYLWGAQVEAGAFSTSYVRNTTTSAPVTRNADAVSMTGTNFSAWYNAGAGTWFMQTNARNAVTILTAGSFTLTANTTGPKKYANIYSSDQSATSLILGNGTAAKILYYKQALSAAEVQALIN